MKRQLERTLDKQFLNDKARKIASYFLNLWRAQVTNKEDLQLIQEGKRIMPTTGEFTAFATRYCIGREDLSFEQQQQLLQTCCAVFLAMTWELAKPLYKFDKTLSSDLAGAFKETSDIPCAVLECLPYWAVLVDNPGSKGILGFLASYTDAKEGEGMLCILPLRSTGHSQMYSLYVEQSHSTVSDIINYNLEASADKDYKRMNKEKLKALRHYLCDCVGKMLYLCSDKPEVSDHLLVEGESQPWSSGKKQKFKPPKEARIIEVGKESGKKARAYMQHMAKSGLERKDVKAHIRQGHWHGFWTGKKDGSEERVYIIKWVSTTFVNLLKEETT